MKKVLINNRWKWIIGEIVFELLSIGILIDELFFDEAMLEIPSRAPDSFPLFFCHGWYIGKSKIWARLK